MKALFIISIIFSIIFSILFIILFVRALRNGRFKGLVYKAKADAIVQMNTELSKKKGYKQFFFDNGNVVIWAKLHKDALSQFINYKRKNG